jgi:hypothetical protein
MIRTTLICIALLSSAGIAQAQAVKVSLVGKSDAAIRRELEQAAKQVCLDVVPLDYAPCVQDTYNSALEKAVKARATK